MEEEERTRLLTERNKNRMNREFLRRMGLRDVKRMEEEERYRRLKEPARIDQPFLRDITSLRKYMVEDTEIKSEEQRILRQSPSVFQASPSVFGRRRKDVPLWRPMRHDVVKQ
jgi:hypothetical protein